MGVFGDRAVAAHAEGFNCSQAVVSAVCEEFGTDRVTALRLSGAFGGGVACSGGMCGAISGAMMLIGMKHSRTSPMDDTSKARCYEVAAEFLHRFKESHGGCVNCRDLLRGNRFDPEEYNVMEQDGRLAWCDDFIRYAAEAAYQLLTE